MIALSPLGLIFLYLLLFLAAIFVVWIGSEMARTQRESRSRNYRFQCAVCGGRFEDRTATLLPRCPHCGNLNERLPIKNI